MQHFVTSVRRARSAIRLIFVVASINYAMLNERSVIRCIKLVRDAIPAPSAQRNNFLPHYSKPRSLGATSYTARSITAG